jgi:hypothetical protein
VYHNFHKNKENPPALPQFSGYRIAEKEEKINIKPQKWNENPPKPFIFASPVKHRGLSANSFSGFIRRTSGGFIRRSLPATPYGGLARRRRGGIRHQPIYSSPHSKILIPKALT